MSDRDLRARERAHAQDPTPAARARLESTRRRLGLTWPAAWGAPRRESTAQGAALAWHLTPDQPLGRARSDALELLRRLLPLLDPDAPGLELASESVLPLAVGPEDQFAFGRRERYGSSAAGVELRLETRGLGDGGSTASWEALTATGYGLARGASLRLELEVRPPGPGRGRLTLDGPPERLARVLDALPAVAGA